MTVAKTFAYVSVLTLITLARPASAATPTFPVLSQSDFDGVIRELSANSLFHSVTPPSSLGSILGFEMGLVGGVTSTPEIDRLVQQQQPGTAVKYFPHAGVLGAVSFPIPLTAEVLYIPQVSAQGVKYDSYGAALKWTPTNDILPLPLNLAMRGFISRTRVQFDQVVNSAYATVTYEGQVMGLQLLASPKLLPLIEPYGGIGWVRASGRMNVTGTSTLFNFTQSQSAESNPSSLDLVLGADLRLLLFGVGAQWERAFNTDAFTAKASLQF